MTFVIELAYLHAGHKDCEATTDLAGERVGELELAIPAFRVGKAYYKRIGKEAERTSFNST